MALFGSFWKKDSGNSRKTSSPGKWRVGDKIASYEIHQALGGGMGIVYVCYDHKNDSVCVLKTFQERFSLSEESQKLFEREALIWTELEKHLYIVRALTVERLERRLFIILEYIPPDSQMRNTLTHYLGELTFPEILKFSIQFCFGMEYAYSKGIEAHRDIKPDNIMIAPEMTVKITDFGLAKAFQEIEIGKDIISPGGKANLSTFQTKGGKKVCGTLPYMAPEQFDGYADRRSDIYAFGVTLYQVVTGGKLPFIGSTPQEYERLHKEEKTPPIPSPLFPIIQKCLEKNPNRRYQDFTVIREELQDIFTKETGEKIFLPNAIKSEVWEVFNKGKALIALGKFQKAISCFDKAIDSCPQDYEAWAHKGVALYKLGELDEALLCYERALKIEPLFSMAWHNKGAVLNDLSRFNEAAACYEKVLEINPDDVASLYCKADTLTNLGNKEAAIKCYERIININPKNLFFLKLAWLNKGINLTILGRSREALRCAEEALRLDSNLPEAHKLKQLINENLGKGVLSDNSIEDGKSIFSEEETQIKADARDYYNKGVDFTNLGKYEEAISCYNKAININQRFVEAWYNKGSALSDLNKYEEAVTCYGKAIDITPDYAEAWNNKGLALANLHRYDEALKCITEALKLRPNLVQAQKLKKAILKELKKIPSANKIKLKVQKHDKRGVVLYNLGRHLKAIFCFCKAPKKKLL